MKPHEEAVFVDLIEQFAKEVNEYSKKQGFWAHETLACPGCGYEIDNPSVDAEKVALMHSELSELLERLRVEPEARDVHCPEFTNFEIELADEVIRVLEFAHHHAARIGSALLAKAEYNRSRPPKHGKRF